MADDPGFLILVGVKLPDLVAGFFGGLVNAFVMKRSDPWSIVGSMVVGSLTANYLSEPIGRYLGTGIGTTGFIVGIGGMAICQGIVEASRTWRPFGGTSNKGGSDAGSSPQRD
jgi:uncharacterized membrane protein YeaQ/YmgE (transglycosylase-associated protein family)